MTFVQKVRAFNVDEIDGSSVKKPTYSCTIWSFLFTVPCSRSCSQLTTEKGIHLSPGPAADQGTPAEQVRDQKSVMYYSNESK